MSKSSKKPAHVWVVFMQSGGPMYACDTKAEARSIAVADDQVAKYTLAPAPEAKPKPAPVPEPVAELTPWFDCDTPPVRPGVYERDHGDGCPLVFQLWNGYWWGQFMVTPELAADDQVASKASCYQRGKWRGYTTNQEAAK